MIDAIDHGITFMELILVECGISDLVVLAGNHRALRPLGVAACQRLNIGSRMSREAHVRAAAYLAASTTRPFPALVGKSDTMNRWCGIEFS